MSADLSSHAPLIDRLRGRAFLPGVHYAAQAEAWMDEAADEIERLRGWKAEASIVLEEWTKVTAEAYEALNRPIEMLGRWNSDIVRVALAAVKS